MKNKHILFFLNFFTTNQTQVKSDKKKEKKIQRQKRNKKTKTKKSHTSRGEESSRLKANSKVDTSGPFFIFLCLFLRFPFFFPFSPLPLSLFCPLGQKDTAETKQNKTKKEM